MNPDELPLRDIHLPAPVSWWPPAPGWWMLLLGAAVLVVVLFWWRRRKLAIARAPATLARIELDKLRAAWVAQGDPQRLLRDISIWLRRASMALTTRREVASLTGSEWQQQLAAMAGAAVFNEAEGKLLTEASYRGNLPAGVNIDAAHLLAQCERWLDASARRVQRK
jgi:hypothetical protein